MGALMKPDEVNCAEANWMIQVGKLTNRLDRVVIKNFDGTPISLGFIKTLTSQNSFVAYYDDCDLVLERAILIHHAPIQSRVRH